MFHFEPVGKYLVAVCTNIACMLQGAYRLLEHAEERLGVAPGGTTEDGLFTLEDAECLALCGNAPCVTVNWRFFGDVDEDGFDELVDDLRAGPPGRRGASARNAEPGRSRRRPSSRNRRAWRHWRAGAGRGRRRRVPRRRGPIARTSRPGHPSLHARRPPPWTPATWTVTDDDHRRPPHRQPPARKAALVDARVLPGRRRLPGACGPRWP